VVSGFPTLILAADFDFLPLALLYLLPVSIALIHQQYRD
jgi:hypothetical protein